MAQLQESVSITEYLATAYHPDVDYVDGRIEERNVGEKSHASYNGESLTYWKEHLGSSRSLRRG